MTFLDSNILIYAFAADARTERAQSLLSDATIGVQGLNEFTAVAKAKLAMTWDEIAGAIEAIQTLCAGEPIPVTVALHAQGRRISEQYRLAFYDSVMIAAALECGATDFLTEDLHDGLVIDGRLTIRNPFRR